MVFTLLRGPVSAFMNVGATFSRFDMPEYRSQLVMIKLAYVATNCLTLALGIYKVNKMVSLPTGAFGRPCLLILSRVYCLPQDRTGLRGRHSGCLWSVRIRQYNISRPYRSNQ